MKTAFINILSITFLLVITSCNSGKKTETPTTDEQQMDLVGDNSMTSLDWDGTYEGELPCADCDGIKTVMTINQDNTYVLKETYVGKNATPYETKGTFKWDDKGQNIILSDASRPSYFVGENTLTYLDKDGEKVIGDLESLYVLDKVQEQLVGKKWHLASFKGKDIHYKEAMSEHAYIEFQEDSTLLGYTGCNNIQGAYEVGDALKLKFSKLVNTLKSCPEMETEAEFLKTVNATVTYAFENNALVMFDEDHQKLATFKPAN